MNEPSEFVEFLKSAVEGLLPLEIMYQGHVRYVLPTLLGEAVGGRLVLHCIQYAGSSKDGPVTEPGWKFLYLDKMASADYGGYDRADAGMGALSKSYGEGFSEGEYKPPKFITKVLAIVRKKILYSPSVAP